MEKLLIAFLFSLLMITNSIAQQHPHDLLIMSYNIYHGENPYQRGTSNVGDITELINKLKPDFLALQEVDSMTLRTAGFEGRKLDLTDIWAKSSGMNGFFAKAIDFSEGGYGEAVLVRKKAVFESVSLPTPMGGEGRSMAVAHVVLEDGRKISFAGTHLCHEFEENRSAQVKAIKDYFKGYSHPVVVVGDFNFESLEEGYALMSEDFLDAAMIFGETKNTYPTDQPKIRIDYIWLVKNTNWVVKDFQVMEEIVHSDHLPLYSVVSFQ